MILNHLTTTAFSSSIDVLNALMVDPQEKYLYYDYLKSPTWKLRTEIYVNFYENKCQRCGKIFTKGLTLHHLHYDSLCVENYTDVKLVCKRCHRIIHNND